VRGCARETARHPARIRLSYQRCNSARSSRTISRAEPVVVRQRLSRRRHRLDPTRPVDGQPHAPADDRARRLPFLRTPPVARDSVAGHHHNCRHGVAGYLKISFNTTVKMRLDFGKSSYVHGPDAPTPSRWSSPFVGAYVPFLRHTRRKPYFRTSARRSPSGDGNFPPRNAVRRRRKMISCRRTAISRQRTPSAVGGRRFPSADAISHRQTPFAVSGR